MNTITTEDFKFQGLNLKMPAILPAHDLSCFLSLLLLEKFGILQRPRNWALSRVEKLRVV